MTLRPGLRAAAVSRLHGPALPVAAAAAREKRGMCEGDGGARQVSMCLREEWRGTSLNATARAALLGCGLALGRGLLGEIRALEVKFERAVAPCNEKML